VSQDLSAALLLTFARRGEEGAIRDAMDALRRALPEARIEAIGTPVSAPLLRELGVEELIVYGDGAGPLEVVCQARARRFSAAALVYSGPGFSGHLKLETLALLAGAKRFHRIGPDREGRPIGRLRIALSICLKCLQAVGRVLLAGMLCLTAFLCLRLRQSLAGGHRASRT
jgi:hypothetical protein